MTLSSYNNDKGSGFDDINPDDTDQACDGGACVSCPPGYIHFSSSCLSFSSLSLSLSLYL